MTIEAVFFDLDDTLVPERSAWAAAFDIACAGFCSSHNVEVSELLREVFDAAQELWQASPVSEWCRQLGIGSPSSLLSDFPGAGVQLAYLRDWAPIYRAQVWGEALERVGFKGANGSASLPEAFRNAFRAGHIAYPDVIPALDGLAGLKLGVISNGNADLQRDKLRASGLEPYFGATVISAEVGVGKPDARIFELALDALGVHADDAVMVGDSQERDITGAHRAGLHCVWLDRDSTFQAPAPPHHRIESLSNLAAALAGFSGHGDH